MSCWLFAFASGITTKTLPTHANWRPHTQKHMYTKFAQLFRSINLCRRFTHTRTQKLMNPCGEDETHTVSNGNEHIFTSFDSKRWHTAYTWLKNYRLYEWWIEGRKTNRERQRAAVNWEKKKKEWKDTYTKIDISMSIRLKICPPNIAW